MDLRPGDTVYGADNKPFTIVSSLGAGSFGHVFKIHDKDGERYALKTVPTGQLGNVELRALLNEGSLMPEIQHKNVIRVYYFHDGRTYDELPPYIVMEYADGGTLKDIIGRRREQKSFLTLKELRSFMMELASGMKAVNGKVVHRDIWPNNVLISGGALKISDFGLSKVVGALTRTKSFKGINNLMYCAPEAWKMEKNLPAMDMYSMGIVFYELATLSHPYRIPCNADQSLEWYEAHLYQTPQEPRAINPSLDVGISQMIMKMMSKRAEDRYADWDAVIARLKEPKKQDSKGIDVSSLVEAAIETDRMQQQKSLGAQEEARKRQECEEAMRFCFKEIIGAAEQVVEDFNAAQDLKKLKVNVRSAVQFFIIEEPLEQPSVNAIVFPVYHHQSLHNKPIKAWGHVQGPSGRGFNLVLLAQSEDDPYGSWMSLSFKHSPIAQPRDNRPEPFPMSQDELPHEITHVSSGATHIYQHELTPFSAQQLAPLIEEVVKWVY